MSNLKPNYFTHNIKSTFTSKKMFFWLWKPVQMSKYNELKNDFKHQELPIDWSVGMIEQAPMIGFGKIGLANLKGDWKIESEFIAFKITGDYYQIKDAYKNIMIDYPKACNFYNLYLTDPNVTPMSDNITYILFQSK